jgi:hypothetical protein
MRREVGASLISAVKYKPPDFRGRLFQKPVVQIAVRLSFHAAAH